MSSNYLRAHLNKPTPQSEPLDDTQIKNRAGGHVYKIDPLDQVRRFLVMGTEGGTFYANEREMTKENTKNLSKTIKSNGIEVVKIAAEISEGGRAANNDMALFALAVAMTDGDLETKRAAREVYTRVARTGTHHLTFVDFLTSMRGIGKIPKFAIGDWYKEKSDDQLAYQVTKYQNRSGWTHRDVLQKIHWGLNTPLYRWITRNQMDARENFGGKHKSAFGELPHIIQGYEVAKDLSNSQSATDKDVIKAIKTYGLTHEMVPNKFKNSVKLWETLLPKMNVGALVRNLGKMSSIKMFPNMSSKNDNTDLVIDKINPESVKKARLHPITLLGALKTYQNGEGVRGNLEWEANRDICEHLEEAFYWTFDSLEPSGKNMMLALDVSSSMTWSYPMASNPQLTCAHVTAVMAMVTLRTERHAHIYAFAHDFKEIPISKRSTLNEVLSETEKANFGGTDCSLPMLKAIERRWEVDGFAIYTDNETWAGNVHPKVALDNYRQKSGRDARVAVVGMTATDCSIADPNVNYMADFIGISTDTPRLISDYLAGRF